MKKKIEGSLISYMSNLVKQNGGINCAQGIPGFDPPRELIEELRNVAYENCHQYAPGCGLPELRKLIAENTGENTHSDNVLITNGATEAISLIYLYIKNNSGTRITTLGFDPVYESYFNLPKIYGDKFIRFEKETDGTIDFDHLEKTVAKEKVKIIFMSSPGNPYGKIFDKNSVEKIVDICRKNNCFLIFDAVYSEIYFSDPPYLPVSKPDKNIFFVSAFSKMLSITGWRLGFLTAHAEHIAKLSEIHDYTGLSSPSVLQKAVFKYLNKSCYGKDYTRSLRTEIKQTFDIMAKELRNIQFFIPETEGGYFIWAKLPPSFDDGLNFALELYEKTKVATVPGIHFSTNYKKWIRINVARDAGEITEAAERIKNFI